MASQAQKSALVALLLASIGGAAFLKVNPEPTLKDVYLACEQGKLSGIVCCEDLNRVKDISKPMESCGAITVGNPDPLGVRKQQETDWMTVQ